MGQTRSAETSYQEPLEIVSSSKFGRVPKISDEYMYNMFVAEENALFNFAGYQFRTNLLGNGRGLFSSKKANSMFAVSENFIYQILSDLTTIQLKTIATDDGDVFIDEDILNNIAVCDQVNIYIHNYVTGINYIAGTNPYNTGTISQTGNAVTGSMTTFTASMVGGTIYYPDNSSALITAYSSATSITVNQSKSLSGVGFLITTPLDFVPNNICFHDGRFISTSASSGGNQIGQWRLSNTATVTGGATYIVFPNTSQFQGGFQTKPDLPISVVRLPGRANNILLMGSTVTESWTDQGLRLFPYVKNTTFNIDFGCINPATIAELENLVVWIGQNERSGPALMYSTGQDAKKISTDGINYLLERLEHPEKCYGFIYLQAGHIFYIFTFYDPADNTSLMYDFTQQRFYNLADENYNFYIAKKTVFFNNTYYFISINDGNIYELNSEFTTYQYQDNVEHEIPRSMILKTYRTKDGTPSVFNDVWFPVEQGIDANYTGQDESVASFKIVDGGQDYTTATLLIEGDGAGANATAILTDGVITSITLNNGGVGYTWAVVTVIGDGAGANIEANLNVPTYVPRVEISCSYDSGYTWSTPTPMELNTYGKYKNRFYQNGLGYSNEFTLQYRIYCTSRFVCSNGQMSFYR
jgi:hypothetical protein